MHSSRYGNLNTLAAKTDGDCHLCHEPADLAFYGPTGAFGPETVTVDHLVPQRDGGGDEAHNLLIAHGTCNSRRGTRDVELARYELAGTVRAPMGSNAKTVVSLGGGTIAALVAGNMFAERNAEGSKKFNEGAAVCAGVLSALLLRCLL